MPSKALLAIVWLPALLTAVAHFQVYRWFVLALPGSKKPLRFTVAVALFVMYALPALRVFSAYNERFRYVAKASVLWHMSICAAALLLVLQQLLAYAQRARRSSQGEREEAGTPQVLPQANSEPALAEEPLDLGRRLTIHRVGGVASLALSGGVVGWGATVGRLDWQVEEIAVPIAGLPRSLDGFTIVQVSDLHVGTFIGERTLRMGLSLIDALRPDLIAITGDVLDHERSFAPVAARALGALRARHGVVCVPGNHDHYAGVRSIVDALSAVGVEVLFNRALRIPGGERGGLFIVGVDDLAGQRRGHGPDLKGALSGVPDDAPRILLAHQPDFFDELGTHRVDLQLSGHTHGGQINPGFVVTRPLIGPYVAGMYERRGTRLYVNRGFGTAGPPCRILAPPEITRIVLVAA